MGTLPSRLPDASPLSDVRQTLWTLPLGAAAGVGGLGVAPTRVRARARARAHEGGGLRSLRAVSVLRALADLGLGLGVSRTERGTHNVTGALAGGW
jgi:hypothetical protein